MEATRTSCCEQEACAGDVGDFARVRYFFGQRLTALDLADEQAYVVGKLRLHHRNLHGWGVVCGLAAERAQPAQGGDGTSRVLRVRAGAAIDCGGREIVVPIDHCIDVSAWYAKRRARLPAAWREAGARDLWLAVRFRDCPSDPVIAPRDPCGCTTEGCEYARVREGFELQFLTDLDDACTEAPAAAQALAALTGSAPTTCPACGDCAGWLVLAKLAVTLDDPDGDGPGTVTVTDIGQPDVAVPERRRLVATWALQALAEQLAQGRDDLASGGPRLGAIEATGTLAAAELHLPVALAMDGPGDTAVALATGTVPDDLVAVRTLDAGAWRALAVTTSWDAANARVVAKLGEPLAAGSIYRLTVLQDPAEPVADDQARVLSPRDLAIRFRAEDQSGALAIVTL